MSVRNDEVLKSEESDSENVRWRNNRMVIFK